MAYATSKGAVMTMTRSLAKELGPAIRVNALCPGMIDTDFHNIHTADAARRGFEAAAVVKRQGVPEDVANLVLFLACDESAFITGANIDINGGVLTIATDSAAWSHSTGAHGQGVIQLYVTPHGNLSVAEMQFRSVNIGPLTEVRFEGSYPLSIQAIDSSGTAGMVFSIASDALDKSFKMTGDYTGYVSEGATIQLRGAAYTVASSKFQSGSTQVVLDKKHGATVGNTFTVDSTAGNITIGANLDASAPPFVKSDNGNLKF